MHKIFECILVTLMGVGPVVMFIVLTESYGRFGLLSALIVCGLYLVLVVIAITLRCCIRRCNPDPEAQQDYASDLPPSYEDVTSKPPPYSFLFATAPPTGDGWSSRQGYGGYVPVHGVTLTCPVPDQLQAAPPSYIEAVNGATEAGTSSGATAYERALDGNMSCGNVSDNVSCGTMSSRVSSTNVSPSQSVNNTRPPSPSTTPPATTTNSHTADRPSSSGQPVPATRVFIIPLPGPSPFPHRCHEVIPLLPT